MDINQDVEIVFTAWKLFFDVRLLFLYYMARVFCMLFSLHVLIIVLFARIKKISASGIIMQHVTTFQFEVDKQNNGEWSLLWKNKNYCVLWPYYGHARSLLCIFFYNYPLKEKKAQTTIEQLYKIFKQCIQQSLWMLKIKQKRTNILKLWKKSNLKEGIR